MKERRILLASFDLFHIGHLGQIDAVAEPHVDLMIAIVSDRGVEQALGTGPYMPAHERAAVLGQVRHVSGVSITGPESEWVLPECDSLFVDEGLLRALASSGVRFPRASAVAVTRLPAHPALAGVLALPSAS